MPNCKSLRIIWKTQEQEKAGSGSDHCLYLMTGGCMVGYRWSAVDGGALDDVNRKLCARLLVAVSIEKKKKKYAEM